MKYGFGWKRKKKRRRRSAGLEEREGGDEWMDESKVDGWMGDFLYCMALNSDTGQWELGILWFSCLRSSFSCVSGFVRDVTRVWGWEMGVGRWMLPLFPGETVRLQPDHYGLDSSRLAAA